jgi:PAS domain-containing protein
VPAAELETAQDTLRQLAAQGHLLVEANLKRKDGGIVPVEINAVQLPDGNLYGACRDIGERRRAEAALRENEERLRALFEFAHDAIMTIAPPDWRFTSCNPATLSLFGVADEQAFRQLGPWDLSPERQPDGRPRRRQPGA